MTDMPETGEPLTQDDILDELVKLGNAQIAPDTPVIVWYGGKEYRGRYYEVVARIAKDFPEKRIITVGPWPTGSSTSE